MRRKGKAGVGGGFACIVPCPCSRGREHGDEQLIMHLNAIDKTPFCCMEREFAVFLVAHPITQLH
jgi:hypothetical protein